MASQTVASIAAQGDRHAQLLAELTRLDYAPAALQDASASLADLRAQEKELSQRVAQLKTKAQTEYEEWKHVQQSKYARFFLRARNKNVDEHVAKEEREYNEAWEAERDCADGLAVLSGQVKATQLTVDELTAKKMRLDDVEQQLTQLYARLFDGPTQGFEEEDEAERALQNAKRDYDATQNTLNGSAQVFSALGKARAAFIISNRKLDEALQYSTYDMFSRGSLADMMERSALAEAKRAALQAAMHYNEARRASPQVAPLPNLDIAQGHVMSDVIFDNFFSDYAMHQRIQQSQGSLRQALAHTTGQIREIEHRVTAAKAAAKQATARLRQTRTELLAIRRRIVIDVAAGEAANAYTPDRPLSGEYSTYADSLLDDIPAEKAPDYSTAPPPGYTR